MNIVRNDDVIVSFYVPSSRFVETRVVSPLVSHFNRTQAECIQELLKDIVTVDLSMSDAAEAAKYMQHKARAALASLSKVQP